MRPPYVLFQELYTKSPQLGQSWQKMNQRDKGRVIRMHDEYESACRAHAQAKHPPEGQAQVAAELLDITDQYVTQHMARHPLAKEVKCHAGCDACCHINVSITEPEAHLLHATVKERGITLDTAKLTRQAATGDDPIAWMAQPDEDRSCVFLDPATRLCTVYQQRPMACRKHFSISDPILCDTKLSPDGNPAYLISIEAEILASAAMTAFEAHGMPTMLLKHTPQES